MNNRRWPIEPDHITNDGATFSENSQLRKLNGLGIISNDHAQGIQTSISVRLNCPTTIIEISPESELVRTDSHVFDYIAHPPCKRFRDFTNHRFCYECDNQHARVFFGLREFELEKVVPERISNNEFIQTYVENSDFTCRFVSEKSRGFLEYDCPILGYRELIYPVLLEYKVIAVFFFGQICLEKRLDFISSVQDNFFSNNPNCFDDYILVHPEMKNVELQLEVRKLHDKWLNDSSHLLNDDDYRTFKDDVFQEIVRFEEILHNNIEIKKENYVRKNIRGINELFEKQNNFDQDNKQEDFKDSLKSVLSNGLRKIVDSFSLDYIIIFGSLSGTINQEGSLEPIAKSSDLKDFVSTSFDLNLFNPDSSNNFIITSDDDEGLFDYLRDLPTDFERDSSFLVIFGSPYDKTEIMALLISHHNLNSYYSNKSEFALFFDSTLKTFFTIAYLSMMSINISISKINMQNTFSLFSHELGIYHSGLDDLRETYLTNPKKLRNLPDKKIEDLQVDIDSFLTHIHFLTENAKSGTDLIIELEKTEFLPYKNLLAKWRDMLRIVAYINCLQFDIPYPLEESPNLRPRIYGDRRYLEQLIFNLVSNATKYCHLGTKIKMDCRKQEIKDYRPHVITVTNYGIPIEKGNKPYELFYRGPDIPEGIKGQGFGLYLSKLIVDKHGGKIYHDCNEISKFNVPLLESYINYPKSDSHLVEEAKYELARLKKEGIYTSVVALDERKNLRYSNPTPNALIDYFRMATFEVTFSVEIPPKENSK